MPLIEGYDVTRNPCVFILLSEVNMGGSKKSSTKVAPKVKPKLESAFNCPFCSHQKSVEVKINRRGAVANLACRVCSVDFQMRVQPLDQAVDVFSEWVDQCHSLNAKNSNA